MPYSWNGTRKAVQYLQGTAVRCAADACMHACMYVYMHISRMHLPHCSSCQELVFLHTYIFSSARVNRLIPVLWFWHAYTHASLTCIHARVPYSGSCWGTRDTAHPALSRSCRQRRHKGIPYGVHHPCKGMDHGVLIVIPVFRPRRASWACYGSVNGKSRAGKRRNATTVNGKPPSTGTDTRPGGGVDATDAPM